MKQGAVVFGLCLCVGLLIFASPSESQTEAGVSHYGFSVAVQPDEEFAGFVRCGIALFNLADEETLDDPPDLHLLAGDSNSMLFIGADGVEVTFTCGVNPEMTEATYEISGRSEGRLVLSHLATVRLP